ncbi:MAG: hypothetical protein C0591_01205 [Marinilabiliales bacterium]|jgi:hypothetical protein|nr:MAG: hypothetical protein C0591_01205 [Marinilabiliales bacterium]
MMKKFTIILIAFIFSASFLNAQSYSLSWDGEPIGDTLLIVGDPSDFEMVFHAILTNNSDDTDTLKVQRRMIHLLDETVHYLCWSVACYAPNRDSIWVAPDSLVLESGQSTLELDFSAHYEPNGVIGTSMVEYTFFNKSDLDEKVTVVVKYKTSPEGIIDRMDKEGYLSELYPNPAISQVNIDYTLTPDVEKANFRVMNLLGAVVKNLEMDKKSSNLRIDVSDLTSGVYFYSVILNNEVYKTKKLILK